MTWADAMGLVVIEGVLITILVLTGLRTGGVPVGADPAEDRDRRRHRAVPDDHRPGRRRVRAPGPGRGQHHRAGRAGHRRQAGHLAGAGLRARPAVHARPVRPAGARRDPDRHPGHHRAGDHRGGDREGRPVVRRRPAEPEGLVAERPDAAGRRSSTLPDLSLLGKFNVLDSWERAGWLVVADVRLHAADHRLLRHHGHDGRGRPGGRPARRGGHAAADPGDPARRLAGGRGRWCGERVQQHLVHRERGRVSREGARTGVANLVTGGLFLLAMFLAPLVIDRAVRGGVDRAGGGRLPDDDGGPADRLDRLRDRACRRSSRSC